MARNRFVVPKTERLELSDGDWIDVNERLTYGQEQRLQEAMLGKMSMDELEKVAEIGLTTARAAVDRLETWIVAWSFRDDEDRPVPVSRSAIENLDPYTADEIDAALTAHIEDLEKNAQTPDGGDVSKKK
jgi:hypothetical protein